MSMLNPALCLIVAKIFKIYFNMLCVLILYGGVEVGLLCLCNWSRTALFRVVIIITLASYLHGACGLLCIGEDGKFKKQQCV